MSRFEDVQDFMLAFGQQVRDVPTTDITPEEQLLRARLVFEEAMEFVDAMGCAVVHDMGQWQIMLKSEYNNAESADIDLPEAADALADSLVVIYGSFATLGIEPKSVFDEVHRSNMAKLGPNGQPILREGDRKVLKPEGWTPPNIAGVLIEQGWRCGCPDRDPYAGCHRHQVTKRGILS